MGPVGSRRFGRGSTSSAEALLLQCSDCSAGALLFSWPCRGHVHNSWPREKRRGVSSCLLRLRRCPAAETLGESMRMHMQKPQCHEVHLPTLVHYVKRTLFKVIYRDL
jgi:hypothetical protein